jgi:nitroreductase
VEGEFIPMKKIAFIAVLLLLFTCVSPAAFAEASTVDAILTAGTTQAFSDEAVPEEDIQTILQAGLASESAINQQPWFFVAVTDKAVMEELSSSGGMPPMGGAMPDAPMGAPAGEAPKDAPMGGAPKDAPAPMAAGGAKAALGDSPLAILVYMDESSKSPNPNFDCGLAVQNMYIAAVSLGYGAKVISSPTMTLNGEKHDQICEELGIDPSLTAVAVLLVGKADETVDGASGASIRADFDSKVSIIG